MGDTKKFWFRVVLSLLVFGFGVGIYFSDTANGSIGINLVSVVWGAWMSAGSTKAKKTYDQMRSSRASNDVDASDSTTLPLTTPKLDDDSDIV